MQNQYQALPDEAPGSSSNTFQAKRQHLERTYESLGFEIKPGSDLHQQILRYGHQRMRLRNEAESRWPKLSWLHISHSWQTALTLSMLYGLSTIVYLSVHGTRLWAEDIDAQHRSDGADPSELQQNKDFAQAQHNAGLLFGLFPIFIALISLAVYWRFDRRQHLTEGYGDFCQAIGLANRRYDTVNHQNLLAGLEGHLFYLFTLSAEPGGRAVALMLRSTQQWIDQYSLQAESRPQPADLEAPSTAVPTQPQLSFLEKLNASLAVHHAFVQLLPGNVDVSKISIHVVHDAHLNEFSKRLDKLQGDLNNVAARIPGLQPEQDNTLSEENFVCFIMLLAIKNLAHPSIKSEEKSFEFLSTLASEPYYHYQDHKVKLGDLLLLFYGRNSDPNFSVYAKLKPEQKQQVQDALTTQGEDGQAINRQLFSLPAATSFRQKTIDRFIQAKNIAGLCAMVNAPGYKRPPHTNDASLVAALLDNESRLTS